VEPFDVLVTEDLTKRSREELEEIFLSRGDGRILFLGRIPVASLYATFLASVYSELTRIVGKASRGLILNASRNGGLRAGRGIKRRYEKKYGELKKDKAIEIARNMVMVWDRCFGWGRFEFEVEDRRIRVKVYESFEAIGHLKLKKEKADDPVCWMLLGYVWGLLEGLLGCKLTGEEKMCLARGDEFCLFELVLE